MNAITFDTLKLAQRLRDEVKFSPEQAERAAVVLSDTFGDWQEHQGTATKADLATAKAELMMAIAETKAETIRWVVGVGFAQIAMIIAVLKLHN